MIPSLTRILGGIGLSGAGIMATVLSLNKPTTASETKVVKLKIDWVKIEKETKEECGDGTRFESKKRNGELLNNRGKSMSEYYKCKQEFETKKLEQIHAESKIK